MLFQMVELYTRRRRPHRLQSREAFWIHQSWAVGCDGDVGILASLCHLSRHS